MKLGTFGTVALAVLFAACGSKNEETPPVVTPPVNDSVVVTPTDTIQRFSYTQQELDSIIQASRNVGRDSVFIEQAEKAKMDSIRVAEGDTYGVYGEDSTAVKVDSVVTETKVDTTKSAGLDTIRVKTPQPLTPRDSL